MGASLAQQGMHRSFTPGLQYAQLPGSRLLSARHLNTSVGGPDLPRERGVERPTWSQPGSAPRPITGHSGIMEPAPADLDVPQKAAFTTLSTGEERSLLQSSQSLYESQCEFAMFPKCI